MLYPKIFVISAPSGAGKSTLIKSAMMVFENLRFSISVTTRKPRPHEINGREYFFKTKEEFNEMIIRNELAEWQEVFGNYYGTPKLAINEWLNSGESVILDIDVYGKRMLDLSFPANIGIFITVPAIDTLKQRLISRNTENIRDMETRLNKAMEEISFASSDGNYKYTIVNDNLAKAEKEFIDIIRREQEAA